MGTLTSMNVDNNSTYTAMGAPVAHAAPVHPQARPKDSSETPVLNASNWQDFATAVTGEEITEVEVEPVPLSAKLLSCVFAPLLPFMGCGMYTVDAKTEAAVLHMGQLTGMENKAGLHCAVPCGMEVRHVSTKQCTMDLPTSKVAAAMLKRQQAKALVDARTLIVEGAVKIAQDAVARLQEDGTVELDDEQKVRIVTNLLTVTCSDTDATPTVSLG